MPHRLTIDSAALERVNTALDHIRAGKMVILVDDEDRENEGDLICAASLVTAESITFMEIRGLGLVDIPAIFGIRSVRQQKRIEVVVQLEEWRHDAVVDRTGLDGETTDILGVPIPRITIPLNPGKNITVIAEVIAMHHLLKWSGIDPAERFNEALIKQMRDKSEITRYLREDHE